MKYLLYSIVLSIVLSSCGSETPSTSPTIKFDYYLRIDQGIPVARSDVRFIYVEDTAKVALQSVQFEGMIMRGVDAGNGIIQYSYNDKMASQDSYNLNFTTKEGQRYDFDFPIAQINDFSIF